MRENKIINTIETERLYLRQWQASDFAPFAEMNANPKVMAYFPKLLTTSMSNTIAKKCQSLIDDNGWGFWAERAMAEKGVKSEKWEKSWQGRGKRLDGGKRNIHRWQTCVWISNTCPRNP